jgi:pimeloyl-ACP methyl ester carboxylesterase
MPVAERRIDVAGVSTVVLDGGDGAPVILLHGGIECGGVYWGPVVGDLVRTRRVIIPDVPGLGASSPVRRLRLDVFADWFTALLSRTGITRPVLVAHSLLGSMAARFAATHGDVLGRLVIYGAPAVGPHRMPWGLRVTAIRFAIRQTERNSDRYERWALHDVDRARRRDPGWFDAFDAYLRSRGGVGHVKRTMRHLVMSQTKQVPDTDLRRIQPPTALLWGRHDRMVPLGIGRYASDRFGWPLHVIEDAGHAAHIERPDAFVRALHAATTEETAS